jgi:hypothetical protein
MKDASVDHRWVVGESQVGFADIPLQALRVIVERDAKINLWC